MYIAFWNSCSVQQLKLPSVDVFYFCLSSTKEVTDIVVSSIAMGGNAYPAPAVLGHGIRADPRSFLRGRGRQEDRLCNKPA